MGTLRLLKDIFSSLLRADVHEDNNDPTRGKLLTMTIIVSD